jgi:hypothetical protein
MLPSERLRIGLATTGGVSLSKSSSSVTIASPPAAVAVVFRRRAAIRADVRRGVVSPPTTLLLTDDAAAVGVRYDVGDDDGNIGAVNVSSFGVDRFFIVVICGDNVEAVPENNITRVIRGDDDVVDAAPTGNDVERLINELADDDAATAVREEGVILLELVRLISGEAFRLPPIPPFGGGTLLLFSPLTDRRICDGDDGDGDDPNAGDNDDTV